MVYQGKPTIRKKIVGRYLRRLRDEAGMSMEEVAAELGVSRAAAYRQETGHTAVSKADAEKYLRLYDVQDQSLAERIVDLARTSRKKGWWESYRKITNLLQVEVADLEDLAASISNYEPMVIPGLLQTDAYSEAVILETNPRLRLGDEDVHKSLELRNQRKAILDRENKPELKFVLTEIPFTFPVAGVSAMRQQVEHLLALTSEEGVTIQVIQHIPGEGVVAPGRSIMLVTVDGDSPESIVYLDSGLDGNLADDETIIRHMTARFAYLQDRALSPDQTTRYLEGVLHEINGKAGDR